MIQPFFLAEDLSDRVEIHVNNDLDEFTEYNMTPECKQIIESESVTAINNMLRCAADKVSNPKEKQAILDMQR